MTFESTLVQAEERAEFEMEKSAAYAARDAKRARKPKRMHVFDEEEEEEKGEIMLMAMVR